MSSTSSIFQCIVVEGRLDERGRTGVERGGDTRGYEDGVRGWCTNPFCFIFQINMAYEKFRFVLGFNFGTQTNPTF